MNIIGIFFAIVLGILIGYYLSNLNNKRIIRKSIEAIKKQKGDYEEFKKVEDLDPLERKKRKFRLFKRKKKDTHLSEGSDHPKKEEVQIAKEERKVQSPLPPNHSGDASARKDEEIISKKNVLPPVHPHTEENGQEEAK